MTRRPAVTLIEVLVTMFIMAIGMLALLTLFPIAALSMAQALKDDRCASTASMAENIAIALNIRHDPNVLTGFGSSTTIPPMVYVDPYGYNSLGGSNGVCNVKLGGVIPRVAPIFIAGPSPNPLQSPSPTAATDRWFSLPDDIAFLANGAPDKSSGYIDRGRQYSYAYLLRQMSSNLAQFNMVQLYVVVYSGRPVNSLPPGGETTLTASVLSSNSLQLSVTGTTIKRGGWILDTNGNFYRVANLADATTGTVVETQQNVQAAVGSSLTIAIMDNVAEVFDKGTSWQP